jgi:hypothetical protein
VALLSEDCKENVGCVLGQLRWEASSHVVFAAEVPNAQSLRPADSYISQQQMALDCCISRGTGQVAETYAIAVRFNRALALRDFRSVFQAADARCV